MSLIALPLPLSGPIAESGDIVAATTSGTGSKWCVGKEQSYGVGPLVALS